ncbi:hypothetical protein [Nonomuraea sp. NPDC003709]|uniref:hypothetical protein n=1 Tax=Nonomuraea sp. NPDC003709 TaxID=3154450 RepID=UPI0033ACBF49
MARTSHGSPLSAVVHAWVLARSNRAQSWRFFTEASSATSRTSRAAPPRRASTWARWAAPLTSCNAVTWDWSRGRTGCGWTRCCPAGSAYCPCRSATAGARSSSTPTTMRHA